MRNEASHPYSKVVLIDDDSAFCSIMACFAESRGIELDTFSSLQEMGSIGKFQEYKVAIVDYDLGKMDGLEVAEYLPVFFKNLPMVLVSAQDRKKTKDHWPSSIKSFIHKDAGPDAIIDEAVKLIPRKLMQ